ncbi:MAG: hypothetical protein HC866_27225 [Leptolyngbyaceae cyanobacterium RU_5_1]|nr:hypothetical protein [Leptolyngbyaceae cyanobacterium RU_5_1]
MNEPVLREICYAGKQRAVITRNRYNCLILNTDRLLIVDVDLGVPNHADPKDCPASCQIAISQQQAVTALESVVAQFPQLGFRVYRTCNGLRYLCTTQEFHPLDSESQRLMQSPYADPLYVRLCKFQATFRARLTPKPWRVEQDEQGERFIYDRTTGMVLPASSPYASYTLVEATSSTEIAQHILNHPERWKPLLYNLYPNDNNPRSLWQQMQTDVLTPEALLALIEQTYPDGDRSEMVRIHSIHVQSLDQIRVETRWIHSDDTDLHSNNHSSTTPIPTLQPQSSSTVAALIAAYTALRQRKGRQLAVQIEQLRQYVVAEIRAVRQQESELTAQQTRLLDQLCTHFAVDARSLLVTPDFETFVRSIFVQTDKRVVETPPLQIAQNPMDWLLNTLPHPLQLHNIQAVRQSRTCA